LTQMRKDRPGFKPLLVGVHWPSQPWGDEQLSDAVSLAPGDGNLAEGLFKSFAERFGGNDAVRDSLRTIIDQAVSAGDPKHLPKSLGDAYRGLDKALGLKHLGAGAAPGSDREEFDPEAIFEEVKEEAAARATFGLLDRDTLLAPLRTL